MSFNALVSGADCGPVNALSQMVKHAEADRSLQKVGNSFRSIERTSDRLTRPSFRIA